MEPANSSAALADAQRAVAPAGQLQATPVTTRRWPRALIAAAGAALLAGGAGTVYWFTHKEAPVRYVSVPVTRGEVVRAVTATGSVNPVLTIIVGSYVSGVIQTLSCDYNTKVRKGQVCAKIDPRPYQTLVNQSKAELANARAQLVKDKAALTYARIAYTRNVTLLNRAIVSQDAVDDAKSAYDQASAQIQVDKAAIQQKAAAQESAQVNLEYTDIVSPVDGTVVSRNVTIGQTVAASFQTPTLFLIATDLTQMQVDTNVSESDIGALREGNKAMFTVEAFPNHAFEGQVVQVRQAPQTVQNVVTYDVVVGAENKDLLLKPGMTATSRLITDQREDVLRVPDQALRYSPAVPQPAAEASGAAGRMSPTRGQVRVWVLRQGHPVAVSIKPGLDDDSFTEVLEGQLQAGDRVIVGEQRAGGAGASPAQSFRL
ncbi:efflux RND transporter periplasmic adaptor subunit [Cupriavidus basilensis]|uniref:efflux RND transporter periplasmic adaptor subunit n=1 Tax=Cupriavidus basilensis TaxID=68895 RepID=UPI0020A6A62B|nr:efflux RND transporter periplasmic adaptor subunit [Cupriavidus basilensis]MCP3024511.1 efflux RND transporter periplasmic adaptor subunit [Cupriavidus basilensis]